MQIRDLIEKLKAFDETCEVEVEVNAEAPTIAKLVYDVKPGPHKNCVVLTFV